MNKTTGKTNKRFLFIVSKTTTCLNISKGKYADIKLIYSTVKVCFKTTLYIKISQLLNKDHIFLVQTAYTTY